MLLEKNALPRRNIWKFFSSLPCCAMSLSRCRLPGRGATYAHRNTLSSMWIPSAANPYVNLAWHWTPGIAAVSYRKTLLFTAVSLIHTDAAAALQTDTEVNTQSPITVPACR
ncbi:MAG: hypothetical protein GPOALKHO_000198 [Sodalis sp.]|nr:MAG: hypothetical protein GPOALKHO_000198 [Sodalis sp.]